MKKQKEMTSTSRKSENTRISRKAEAKARRKLAKEWDYLSQGLKYRLAAAKEASIQSTLKLEEELFDGLLLALNPRGSSKSENVQKRILRRIIEKRQAQATRRQVGRTEDLLAGYLVRNSSSKCWQSIHDYQYCA